MSQNGENGFDKDKIAELIRKCLALAESPNENEAAAAMAKAQELLDKYNLSMMDVDVKTQVAPELIEAEVEYDERWEVRLYNRVAKENFCRVIFNEETHVVHIVGRQPNVYATYEMSAWLMQQLNRLATQAQIGRPGHTFVGGRLEKQTTSSRQFRINFLLGAVDRIAQRLHEMNALNRQAIPQMQALMINLKSECDAYYNLLFPPDDRHVVKYRPVGTEGYLEGRAAGDRVSIVAPSRHIDSTGGHYLNSGK